MSLGKPAFARKNGLQKGGKVYKWSPIPSDKRASKSNAGGRKYYCSATPRSQGEDWIVTYTYVIRVDGGVQYRDAYVACDYVR